MDKDLSIENIISTLKLYFFMHHYIYIAFLSLVSFILSFILTFFTIKALEIRFKSVKIFKKSIFLLFFNITFLSFSSVFISHKINFVNSFFSTYFIAFIYFLIIDSLSFLEIYLLKKYDIKTDLEKRATFTQIKLFNKIFSIIVLIISIAIVFLHFEPLKKIGITILESAGIFTVVIGFAAQKTLGLLIAGIQIALSQPFKIGDLISIDSNIGYVVEINFTYVSIKLFDGRVLVIPINYFLDKPFLNLTKYSTRISGSLNLLFSIDANIELIKEKLEKFIKENPLWDQKNLFIGVSDINEKGVQISVFVGSNSFPELGNLQNQIREFAIKLLQENKELIPRLNLKLYEK